MLPSSSKLSFWAAALAAGAPALALVAKDGKTGKLPALGWNSWNAYHCDVDASKILTAAQALVDLGLRDAGYIYTNIDDCWEVQTGRNSAGQLVPNGTTFPNGISGVADSVHNMSLKLGIYNSAGTETCAGYPGSLMHEATDAATWASWGVDYLKYDNCNVPANWTDQYVFCDPDYVNATANGTCNTELDPTLAPPGYDWSTSLSADRYARMRDALEAQNRTILYSLCEWGTAGVYDWGNETAMSWRMSNDIEPDWADVTRIWNENSFRLNSVGFWAHNDMDMLEVNNGNLTADETKSHFALWAAMKSPLLIGTDLSNISDANVDVLKNKYLLAFNQDDVYGGPVTPYKWGTNPDWTFNTSWPAEFFSGASQAGTLVLALNPSEETTSKAIVWSEVPELDGDSYKATDVWTGDDLGCVKTNYSSAVASHGVSAILVGDSC